MQHGARLRRAGQLRDQHRRPLRQDRRHRHRHRRRRRPATRRHVPVLLDFGKYSQQHRRRRHRPRLGADLASTPQDQALVTPTMAFWGGPIGMFTSHGVVVATRPRGRTGGRHGRPQPDARPADRPLRPRRGHRRRRDAALGHGHQLAAPTTSCSSARSRRATPARARTSLTGDGVGDNREAAGINTHIYVDSLMRRASGSWPARARRWSTARWPTASSCRIRRPWPALP